MYTLILCLFIACLLPYVAKIPVAFAMFKRPGGYDNHYPRTQQAHLSGFGARAMAAHQNSFESLIIFSAAVLTAISTERSTETIQILAIVYVVSRFIYLLFYLLNLAFLRSSIWAIGLIASLSIIWQCLP